MDKKSAAIYARIIQNTKKSKKAIHKYKTYSLLADESYSEIKCDGILIDFDKRKGIFISSTGEKNELFIWAHSSHQGKQFREVGKLVIKPGAINVISISVETIRIPRSRT